MADGVSFFYEKRGKNRHKDRHITETNKTTQDEKCDGIPTAVHVVAVPPEHVAVAAVTHDEFEAHQAHPNTDAAAQYVHPIVVYVPHMSTKQHCRKGKKGLEWITKRSRGKKNKGGN